jgi:hypothetical protein
MNNDTSKIQYRKITEYNLATSSLLLSDLFPIERTFNGVIIVKFNLRSRYEDVNMIVQIFDYDTKICVFIQDYPDVPYGAKLTVSPGHYIMEIRESDNLYFIELR